MKNSENKKITGILIFIGLFLALIPIALYSNNAKTQEIANNHKEAINSKEKQIIYLGRPTCSFCQMFEPVLIELSEQYEFDYYYINTDAINKSQLISILKELGMDPDKFVTPYLLFMENGEIVDEQVGYVEAKVLFDELKANGYAEGEYVNIDPINYIAFNEYETLLKEKTNNVLVVGQTTCTYCIQTKPTLKSIIRAEEIVINYIEFDLLSAEESAVVAPFLDANIIPEGEDGWGTPTMMIINDGKVIDFLAGAHTKETYEMFLKRNSIIE